MDRGTYRVRVKGDLGEEEKWDLFLIRSPKGRVGRERQVHQEEKTKISEWSELLFLSGLFLFTPF